MEQSKHLHNIMSRHNRTTNVQIIFLDVEKYSMRRTQGQVDVIDAFTECLNSALTETARRYIDYAQSNDVNFAADVIRLPTGDGAAIGFTFDGLHDAHLFLSEAILHEADERRSQSPCDKFSSAGWCNCHSHFNLRVGIAEGKAILYKDVNGAYNLAGGTINIAARVMSRMGRNQIGLTKEAYDQIVDMVDDPAMSDRFRNYDNVAIKHGLRTTIYQYLAADKHYINNDSVEELTISTAVESAMARMSSSGFPVPDFGQDRMEAGRATLAIIETIENAMAMMKGIARKEASLEGRVSDERNPPTG